MNDPFDRYTERARKVLSLAQEEAQHFNHNYIGTEHLLLGLVREGDGVAARVLSNLGVELNKVRSAVEFIIGRGDRIVLGEIRPTPRAKKVMSLAEDEARRLGHHYIGTEHILLGLVREGEGIAAGVLQSLGISLEKVRAETIAVLSGTTSVTPPSRASLTRTATVLTAYTPDSQHLIRLAQLEARHAAKNALSDDHLLLGLVLEGQSLAARTLDKHGVTVTSLRDALAAVITPASAEPAEPAVTPLAQQIVRLAAETATEAQASAIAPEHLLLGILRAPEGGALAALRTLGIDPIALLTELASDQGDDTTSG